MPWYHAQLQWKRPLHEAGACCTSCNRNCLLEPCIVIQFHAYMYVSPAFLHLQRSAQFHLISSLTPGLLLLHIDPTLPLTRIRKQRQSPELIDIIQTDKNNQLRKSTPSSNESRFPPHRRTQTTMSSSSSFRALLTTILLATTTITTTAATPLTKRNLGGVRLCDQANWGGNCWYGIVPPSTCMALNSL
jgi:hypothetical protein